MKIFIRVFLGILKNSLTSLLHWAPQFCIMFTTKDKKGHIKVSLTLTFKVNCQGQVIDFVFFEILDLEKVRIDTEILSLPNIQPEIRKVILVYIYDLGFEGQPSRSSDLL